MSSLCGLPREIISLEIAFFLRNEDLYRAGLVCKYLMETFRADVLWKKKFNQIGVVLGTECRNESESWYMCYVKAMKRIKEFESTFLDLRLTTRPNNQYRPFSCRISDIKPRRVVNGEKYSEFPKVKVLHEITPTLDKNVEMAFSKAPWKVHKLVMSDDYKPRGDVGEEGRFNFWREVDDPMTCLLECIQPRQLKKYKYHRMWGYNLGCANNSDFDGSHTSQEDKQWGKKIMKSFDNLQEFIKKERKKKRPQPYVIQAEVLMELMVNRMPCRGSKWYFCGSIKELTEYQDLDTVECLVCLDHEMDKAYSLIFYYNRYWG